MENSYTSWSEDDSEPEDTDKLPILKRNVVKIVSKLESDMKNNFIDSEEFIKHMNVETNENMLPNQVEVRPPI